MTEQTFGLVAIEQRLFAARSNGLYHSDDMGQNWHNSFASLQLDIPVSTYAVLAYDEHILAGTDGGFARSTDRGATWNIVRLPDPPPRIVCFGTLPQGVVLAGTMGDGIYRSSDFGATWATANFGLLDLTVYSLAATDHGIFAGTDSGLFLSRNAGWSWQEIELPGGYEPVLSLSASATGLLVGTESKGVLKKGTSWLELGLYGEPINAIFGPFVLAGDRIMRYVNEGWESVIDDVVIAAAYIETAVLAMRSSGTVSPVSKAS